MPKIIELTVEIVIEKVSCPGVWLCQGGRVSLTVFALGTSYQTCLLPPIFPLMFKDILYFRKTFQETCAVNNICCLLKDETMYCELVQWAEDCDTKSCTILAQYLGALNDVLFPPNMCSNEGVDLLMRRSKEFPGILSPKIEIATKVRIDEVWDCGSGSKCPKPKVSCHCTPYDLESSRQRQVCHTPTYHRKKCTGASKRPTATSKTRSRSRPRSGGAQSCCSLKDNSIHTTYKCPNLPPDRLPPACRRPCTRYNICNLSTNARPNVNAASLNSVPRSPSCSLRSPSRSPRSPCRSPRSPCRSPRSPSCGSRSPSRSPRSPCHSARSPHHNPPCTPTARGCRQYSVYNVQVNPEDVAWTADKQSDGVDFCDDTRLSDTEQMYSPIEERLQKTLLESRFIGEEIEEKSRFTDKFKKLYRAKNHPCVCEICKRYHELFHADCSTS